MQWIVQPLSFFVSSAVSSENNTDKTFIDGGIKISL